MAARNSWVQGGRGGDSRRIRSVTPKCAAAVATASSSKADGSVGSGLCVTQLALLTPAPLNEAQADPRGLQ